MNIQAVINIIMKVKRLNNSCILTTHSIMHSKKSCRAEMLNKCLPEIRERLKQSPTRQVITTNKTSSWARAHFGLSLSHKTVRTTAWCLNIVYTTKEEADVSNYRIYKSLTYQLLFSAISMISWWYAGRYRCWPL